MVGAKIQKLLPILHWFRFNWGRPFWAHFWPAILLIFVELENKECFHACHFCSIISAKFSLRSKNSHFYTMHPEFSFAGQNSKLMPKFCTDFGSPQDHKNKLKFFSGNSSPRDCLAARFDFNCGTEFKIIGEILHRFRCKLHYFMLQSKLQVQNCA